jgi:hypothetical protein
LTGWPAFLEGTGWVVRVIDSEKTQVITDVTCQYLLDDA